MQTTKSADGTVIAYDRTGDGPPLIVAVGAFCDRRSFVPPDESDRAVHRLHLRPARPG